jgi:anti-sigma-K factor RskA
MTEPMRPRLTCHEADALAGAWGLGALDLDEAREVTDHLATCDRPHAELRAAPGAGSVLEAALEPVEPSPGLRGRIMDSIGVQGEPRASAIVPWYRAWLPRAAGLAVAAAIVGLAVWNVQLRGDLDQRRAELQRVAAALSSGGPSYEVAGAAGNGLLITGEEGPIFVAALPRPDDDELYEMWLIGASGPVAVGTFVPREQDVLVIAPLERDLGGFETFAITVEAERVDAPTGDPVLLAALD